MGVSFSFVENPGAGSTKMIRKCIRNAQGLPVECFCAAYSAEHLILWPTRRVRMSFPPHSQTTHIHPRQASGWPAHSPRQALPCELGALATSPDCGGTFVCPLRSVGSQEPSPQLDRKRGGKRPHIKPPQFLRIRYNQKIFGREEHRHGLGWTRRDPSTMNDTTHHRFNV